MWQVVYGASLWENVLEVFSWQWAVWVIALMLLVQGAASGPCDRSVKLDVSAEKLQQHRSGSAHDWRRGIFPIFPRGIEWLPLLFFGLAFLIFFPWAYTGVMSFFEKVRLVLHSSFKLSLRCLFPWLPSCCRTLVGGAGCSQCVTPEVTTVKKPVLAPVGLPLVVAFASFPSPRLVLSLRPFCVGGWV